MTVRVATVLTARDWEANLVAHARESAVIRVVLRAFQPRDIDDHLSGVDVVVASGDVSWLTPAHVASWRQQGVAVVGVYPAGDVPASQLLMAGGATEVIPDDTDISGLVQAITFVAPTTADDRVSDRGVVTAVAGSRGAPGCTEVAIAYALQVAERSSCLLIDLDLDAPSIAIRLGLAPRPDITDVSDSVRDDGTLARSDLHMYGPLAVITGSHRPGESKIRAAHAETVVRAATSRYDEVVVDIGVTGGESSFLQDADHAILVVDGSAVGVVRAAQTVARWMGPAPAVVLNRVSPSERSHLVEATRKWTGLDPAVVLMDRSRVRRATVSSNPPDRRFSRRVGRLNVSP